MPGLEGQTHACDRVVHSFTSALTTSDLRQDTQPSQDGVKIARHTVLRVLCALHHLVRTAGAVTDNLGFDPRAGDMLFPGSWPLQEGLYFVQKQRELPISAAQMPLSEMATCVN